MRKLIALISILLSISLLAACSRTQTGGGEEEDDEGKTTIVFTHWGSTFERDCFEAVCRKYESENPDIIVKNIYIPDDEYTAKVATMLAGEQQIDCGMMISSDLYVWGEQGYFTNIYTLLDKDPELSREDFIDGVFYEVEPEVSSYGWYIASEPMGLFYNKDVFDETGINYPVREQTDPMEWDEFVTLCQKLTLDASGRNALDPDFDPNTIVRYGISIGNTNFRAYIPFIYNGGGRIFDESGNYAFDSEKSLAAIQNIQDLIFKYHVMPKPTDLKNMPSGAVSLASGQVAMLADGQWNLLDLGQLGCSFDVAVLPVMNGEREFIATNNCDAMVIFKGEHEQESYEFLKYLLNPENSPELYQNGLHMPILKKYLSSQFLKEWAVGEAHPSGFTSTFVEPLLHGTHVDYWRLQAREKCPELETLFNTKFEKIMIEGADVRQVMIEEVRPEAEKILEE